MFHSAVLFLLLLAAGSPNSTALLRSGLQALQSGHLEQSKSDLVQASKLDPKNPAVWASLAEVYARLHDPKLAANAAAQAEKTGQGNPVIAHALALYYSEAGQDYLQAGDEPQALTLAGKAAQNDPQVAFQWTQLLLRRQEFSPAADLVTQALQKYPDNAQLVLALGVARYGQRRFDEAIATFLKVIHIDATIPQPYDFLGRMLDQAGPHLAEITQLYEKRAAAEPQNAKAHLLLAKALLMSDSKSQQAETLLRRSIDLDAKDWEGHYELGVLLANAHRYPEAAPELARATELDAKQPMPHYHLARVYDRLGEPEKAAAERAAHAALMNSGKQ